jgi:hypothetical protein
VRLHNCASGRAFFAKHALEPNPSGGAAQWGWQTAKADRKSLGGAASSSARLLLLTERQLEIALKSMPIYC